MVSPQYYTSGEPFGGCLMSEFELRLDDLSEGLFLDVSHHNLNVDSKRNAKGLGEPILQGDVALMLLEPGELREVLEVKWNGTPVIARVVGELVVLAKVNALTDIFAPDERRLPVLRTIGGLSSVMREIIPACNEGQYYVDPEISSEDLLARIMGVPESVFMIAAGMLSSDGRVG